MNDTIKLYDKPQGIIKMNNPAESCRVSNIKKLPSFPDLIGESRLRLRESGELYTGPGFPFSRETLDYLDKPENDMRKSVASYRELLN